MNRLYKFQRWWDRTTYPVRWRWAEATAWLALHLPWKDYTKICQECFAYYDPHIKHCPYCCSTAHFREAIEDQPT